MTRMDDFERRVVETLRWYADEVRPVVDAVEVAHRAAAAHPRRRMGALPWRSIAVPHLGPPLRLAWLLLLLAGLLIALVGGLLISGSQPDQESRVVLRPVDEVFTCPPGTDPDEPGPVDQARPGDLSPMALDQRAGKLVSVTVGDPGIPATWTFDLCTNTWTRMDPDREPPHPVGPLIYDVDSDVTIGVFSDDVWAYHLQTNSWTEKGPAKGSPAVYDPVTGLVVTRSDDGLSYYDVETDTWTPIDEATEPGLDAFVAPLTYDASIDEIVFYEPGQTWLFDLRTGTWSRSHAETPHLVGGYGLSPPMVAYDEQAARTVVLGFDPNVTPSYAPVSTYDAAADHWEVVDDPTGFDLVPSTMVYDPVNRRLVGLAPQRGNALVGIEGVVVGFDLEAVEWTVLLELDGGQPVPSDT